MIEIDMLKRLFMIDPVACALIFMIYLNTRPFKKKLESMDERVTILETHMEAK